MVANMEHVANAVILSPCFIFCVDFCDRDHRGMEVFLALCSFLFHSIDYRAGLSGLNRKDQEYETIPLIEPSTQLLSLVRIGL